MASAGEPRLLLVRAEPHPPAGVVVSISDTGVGVPPTMPNGSSTRSSRPRLTGWGWVLQSADRSWRRTTAACGRFRTLRAARHASSPCTAAVRASPNPDETVAGLLLMPLVRTDARRLKTPAAQPSRSEEKDRRPGEACHRYDHVVRADLSAATRVENPPTCRAQVQNRYSSAVCRLQVIELQGFIVGGEGGIRSRDPRSHQRLRRDSKPSIHQIHSKPEYQVQNRYRAIAPLQNLGRGREFEP